MQITLDSIDKNCILSIHNFRLEQSLINYSLLFSCEKKTQRLKEVALIYESNAQKNFNPEFDEGDIDDNIWSAKLIFQEQLEHMESAFILSSAIDLFHLWEKSLKEWLCNQLRHQAKNPQKLYKRLWIETTSTLIDMLMWQSSFRCHQKISLSKIKELLIIANAYKHGEGGSFEALKAQYPKYLNQSPHKYMQIIPHGPSTQYNDLHMTIEQYESFGKNISQFWKAISLGSPISLYLNPKLNKNLLNALS